MFALLYLRFHLLRWLIYHFWLNRRLFLELLLLHLLYGLLFNLMHNYAFLFLNLFHSLLSLFFLLDASLHDHLQYLFFLFLLLLHYLISLHRRLESRLQILLLYPQKFGVKRYFWGLYWLWLGSGLLLLPLLIEGFLLLPSEFFFYRLFPKELLLLLKHHLQGLLIQLCVSFDHKLFEAEEIFNGHDLLDNLGMLGVGTRFVAGGEKLLLCDIKLCHELAQEFIYQFLERLRGAG